MKENKKYQYEYPRPAVTVDAILCYQRENNAEILLIKRGREPFMGCWALPGGFVEENEDLVDACKRELEEETGLKMDLMSQLFAIGTPGRDPRGHTISVVYYSFVDELVKATAGDDAMQAQWFPIKNLPAMAFDHREIIQYFIETALL